jgi:hypothetical protein
VPSRVVVPKLVPLVFIVVKHIVCVDPLVRVAQIVPVSEYVSVKRSSRVLVEPRQCIVVNHIVCVVHNALVDPIAPVLVPVTVS